MIWVLIAIVAMFLLSAVICIPDKLRRKGKK
jgi:hypothetical protein